jgi:hypothetical protein
MANSWRAHRLAWQIAKTNEAVRAQLDPWTVEVGTRAVGGAFIGMALPGSPALLATLTTLGAPAAPIALFASMGAGTVTFPVLLRALDRRSAVERRWSDLTSKEQRVFAAAGWEPSVDPSSNGQSSRSSSRSSPSAPAE